MIEFEIIIPGPNKISLVEIVKNLTKRTLYDFAIEYLTKHIYVNSCKLAIYYICEVYDLTPTRHDFNKVKLSLTHRFSQVIPLLLEEHKIVRYSPKLYKKVELPKISSKKHSKQYSKVINKTTSHLIYYQGSFVNPKDYKIL